MTHQSGIRLSKLQTLNASKPDRCRIMEITYLQSFCNRSQAEIEYR